MNLRGFVLTLNALVFVLYGLSFVFIPEKMSHFVTGGIPATSSGMIDLRATYGGMSLAIGVLLFIFANRRDLASIGLVTVVAIMLGMAGGRLIGMIIDGDANQVMYVYLALELVMAVLAGALILWARRT